MTHDGEKLPCLPLADLSSIQEKLGAEVYDKVFLLSMINSVSGVVSFHCGVYLCLI